MIFSDKNIVFITAIDFPNGLSVTARIKNIAKVFINMGFGTYIFSPYTPGMVSKGINTETEGLFEGIYYNCCNKIINKPSNNFSLILWNIIGPFLVLKNLIKLQKKINIKYIHLYNVNNTGFEDLIYIFFCKIYKIKIIVDIVDSSAYLSSKDSKEENKFFRYLIHKLKELSSKIKSNVTIKKANIIFYISEYLKNKLRSLNTKAKFIYMPPLVDASKWSVKLMNSDKTFKIIYAGNIKKFEGLDFLLDSIKYLLLNKKKIKCLIYGSTLHNKVYTDKIKNLIKENKLEKFVEIFPSVSQESLYAILSHANILVIPRKKNEINEAGFSQKFADYLLTGVPILSTKFGEITRHLQDRINIFYSDEGDSKKFGDKILEIMNNPNLATKVGLSGRRYVEEHFDIQQITKRIKNNFV